MTSEKQRDQNRVFSSESEMQAWLSQKIKSSDGLSDLILNGDYLDQFTPCCNEEARALKSYKECYSALHINEIISEDENISLRKGDLLKPDFLMYASEIDGIVLVELKNLSGPSREAGTELSAYSGELRTYIPFLSEGDLFNVIISPVWPALLRHYVFQEILYQRKNIICLEPVVIDIDDFALNIVDISKIMECETATKISSKHITGYVVCMYHYEGYGQLQDVNRLDNFLPQMKSALSVMATEGERLKSSGFAFLWKSYLPHAMSPYFISMANLSPFSSIERFMHEIDDIDELSDMQKKFVDLVAIKGLLGHGSSLNNIYTSGERFLNKICSPRREAFQTWEVLQHYMFEMGDLIAFRGWGIFGDLFNELLIQEYEQGCIETDIMSPTLGLRVLDEVIDPLYEFIEISNYKYQ
jgi:hypothetical protein